MATDKMKEKIIDPKYTAEVLDNLTEKQQEKLKEMRETLKADLTEMHDDFMLYRFLEAREWKVSKAVTMFREDLKFRKKWNSDNLEDEWTPPEVLTHYFPNGFFGETRDGYPIYHESAGNTDVRGLVKSATRDQFIKYKIMTGERAHRLFASQSKRHGKLRDKMTCLFDLQGLGFHSIYRPYVSIFAEICAISESHYPEVLHRLYIINPPRMFPIAFAFVKPFLNETTKSKFVFLTGSKEANFEKLKEDIDPKHLPERYGGLAPDPDGTAEGTPLSFGGKVPEKFYLDEIPMGDDAQEITVSRRATHPVPLEVEAGGEISWAFKVTGGDIGFFILDEDGKEVYPARRYESVKIPEEGSHVVEAAGRYILQFDNSYSYLRSKTVTYTATVSIPVTSHDIPDDVTGGISKDEGEVDVDIEEDMDASSLGSHLV